MHSIPDVMQEKRHLGASGKRLALAALVVGVVATLIALPIGGGVRRLLFSYLFAFAFVLSLGLGGLFFVLLQHLTRAGWSVVLRRIAEAITTSLPVLVPLFVPVLLGIGEIYHWSHPEAITADAVLRGKQAYLNVPFFVIRWVIYLGVWTWLQAYFFRRSRRQDASGEPAISLAMQRWSAPAMLAFALTATFAAFDLVMSLDPHWYSTIFGVYFFSGGLVGFLAALTLATFLLQRAGFVRRAITVEHYHDLGKLLFAFTVFWAYIAFSQYMLIWYANIPEETEWFLRRQSNGWGVIGLMLVFGHFLVPFIALLARAPKRRPALLAVAAAWLLVMHAVDVYYLVIPEVSPASAMPGAGDVLLLIGVTALALAYGAYRMRTVSLLPERDPRLGESMAFENA